MTRKQALNNVELIYINSDVPFIASVYLVERTPVAKLIQTMKEERLVTKEQVLEKRKSSARRSEGYNTEYCDFTVQQTQEEDEIIMESDTLSTKDPVSSLLCTTLLDFLTCKYSLHLPVSTHPSDPMLANIFNALMPTYF